MLEIRHVILRLASLQSRHCLAKLDRACAVVQIRLTDPQVAPDTAAVQRSLAERDEV